MGVFTYALWVFSPMVSARSVPYSNREETLCRAFKENCILSKRQRSLKRKKSKLTMKPIICSLFVAMAVSSACMAQTITVAVYPIYKQAPCTFSASSLTDGFATTTTITALGKPTISPITIVKNVDTCSIPLLQELFTGTSIPIVVITLTSATSTLTLTLTGAIVTSLTDADTNSVAPTPSEKVTFIFQTIRIADPAGTTTCSAISNTCS
jgi:type VI protein secretion system component Hcp